MTMEFFGLKDALKSYCDANDIMFVYGRSELREFHFQSENDQSPLNAGDRVLFAGFTSRPQILGKVHAVRYVGFLMLGQKCESNTSAELDETQELKYDRRLGDIEAALAQLIAEFACAEDIEIIDSLEFDEAINQFDENIDCIETPITFSH